MERSLIYCDKHTIDRDRDTPCHERPVFHPSLVQRWHHAYADKFPELASSKKALRKASSLPFAANLQDALLRLNDATSAVPTEAPSVMSALQTGHEEA